MRSGVPFGAYRLLRRLARGGMAEVFLAVKTGPEGFERRVALKRILPHLSDSAEFRTMFLDEARLAARLSHPHVVQVFDFGKVDDYSFIAMELVDGVDVGRLIEPPPGRRGAAPKPVPFAILARIFADVASGLAHAHSVGLVHRDVTPQNLLVSYDGVVKIVDFGIAKAAWQAGHTRPGVVKGKFAYLSPEQVEGRPLDGRSDVFALGICLWETLTGDALFRRDDARAAMKQIREGDGAAFAATARRRRPDLPEALERILARALAFDVDERFESASELQGELERYLKGAAELATAREVGAFVSAVAPRRPLDDAEQSEDGTARVVKVPEKIADELPDEPSDETELSPPLRTATPPQPPQIPEKVAESPSDETELSDPPPIVSPPSKAAPSVHDAPTRFAQLPATDGPGDDATQVAVVVPGELEREVLAAERARATQVNLEAGAAATHEPRKSNETVGQRRARRAAASDARAERGPPGSVTDPVPVEELIADEREGAGSDETTLGVDDEPRERDLSGVAVAPPRAKTPGVDTSASTRLHLPYDHSGDGEPSVTPPTPPSNTPSTPTPTPTPTPPRVARASDGGEGEGEDAPTHDFRRVVPPPAPPGTGLLPRSPFSERTAILALVAVTLVLVVVATVGLIRRSRARTIEDVDPVAPTATVPSLPVVPVVAPTPATAPAPAPRSDGALVDVISRPDGARVLVDGEEVAITPARGLVLTPGEHLLSVELVAHRPRSMNIVVAAGERRTIDIELALIHRPRHPKHR